MSASDDAATTAFVREHVRERVVIANRGNAGVLGWLAKLYVFAALFGVAIAGAGGVWIYSYFSLRTPVARDFRTYLDTVPGVTHMYAADGTLLGEFAKEWREPVPYDRIPPRLVDAFLSIEDHDYWSHGGISWKGIGRAVWANVASGDFAQGASTISQQVAKQELGAEKSLARKAKEAIMARRLESTYSKKAILSVYLNQIYLGAGAYGVSRRRAHRYFGKDLDQLSLGEMALIAGLAKAPTAYSPVAHKDAGVARRNRVLDKMADYGAATPAEVAAAKAEPITLVPFHDVFPDRMPYYAEHVRRYLGEQLRQRAHCPRGLRVETAAEPTWEAAAYDSADFGARHQDKRQGWRGPEWRLDGAARDSSSRARSSATAAARSCPASATSRSSTRSTSDHAEVLVGDRRLQLPLRNMQWAAKWQPGNAENDLTIESATPALKPGYVVWVTREVRSIDRYATRGCPTSTNPSWLGTTTSTSGTPPTPTRSSSSRSRIRRRRSSRPIITVVTSSRWSAAPTTTARCSTARCRRVASPARPTSRSTTRSGSIKAMASTPC